MDNVDLRKYFEEKKGDAVAILCPRYWYRGIVAEVQDSYVVLTQPFAVEETGLPTAPAASIEVGIPGDQMIPYAAIETVIQPVWAFNGYDIKKEIK